MSNSIDISSDLVIVRPSFLGGGQWRIRNRTPITIIFGKNGSGKSILLRSIRDSNPDLFNYIVPERAGEIASQPQDLIQQMDGTSRANLSKQNLNPTYRQQIITRIDALLKKRGASRKTTGPEILEKIEQSLVALLPDFQFKIQGEKDSFLLTRISSGEKITQQIQLSSGEIQLFTLGLDLLSMCNIWKLDEQEGCILLDEPDPHLHYDLQQKFAKFLVDLFDEYHFPIMISTHSTTMLSSLGYYGGKKTSVIYLDQNDELEGKPFDDVLQLLSTCLGGHALMGPLFHFPILLVEGDDDYNIWSEIPRHNSIKISVLPCEGDRIFQYQETLEKIFSSILDVPTTSGYALLDGDKKKKENTQNHIKYIQLNCRESENLYLTDEILKELNLDWDQACEKVIQNCEKCSHIEELKSIKTWNRQNQDLKLVINELAYILDEEHQTWTQRLGKYLGNHPPTGQLSQYLGDEVTNAIWNVN